MQWSEILDGCSYDDAEEGDAVVNMVAWMIKKRYIQTLSLWLSTLGEEKGRPQRKEENREAKIIRLEKGRDGR